MIRRDSSGPAEYAPTVTRAGWEQRKAFVGFGPDDVAVLGELHLVALTYADEVMTELYEHWLGRDELRAYFPDDATLQRVKALQRAYFISLTLGDYGPEYLEDRLRIGRVHRRIGLTPRWYMGAYTTYLNIVLPRVMAAFEYDKVRQCRAVGALMKLIMLDQELALTAYWGGS